MVLELLIGLSYMCYRKFPKWLKTGLAKRTQLTWFLALFFFCIFLFVAFYFLKITFITMIEIEHFLKSDSKYDLYVITDTGVYIAGLLFIMITLLVPVIIGILINFHMNFGGEAGAEDLLIFNRRGGLFN